MQKIALENGAEVVKVIAHHPASLVDDWPFLFVNTFWDENITDGHMLMGLGLMQGEGAAG